jgi:hypothetical protein
VIRIDQFDAAQLDRLLSWADGRRPRPSESERLLAAVPRVDRYRKPAGEREPGGEPLSWARHDPQLAARARDLAALLGYAPEVIPGER